MRWTDIIRELEGDVIYRGTDFERDEVRNIIASDLMSDVLTTDAHAPLLITALASEQTLRTADLIDAAGVVVVRGKTLPDTMKNLARELNLTLVRTRFSQFQACLRLGRLMAADGARGA